MKKTISLIIISTILLCGCGYTTHSFVAADGDNSVYVDNFVNKIDVTQEVSDNDPYYPYDPGMESNITRETINRFIYDGTYQIKDSENAHYLMTGELVNFKREPLRYDTDEDVTEYRLSVVCNVELYDLKKEKVVWQENSFAGESTYRTSGQFAKSEDVALAEATYDFARRIVERTVENW